MRPPCSNNPALRLCVVRLDLELHFTGGLKPPQSCFQGDLADKAILDSGSLSAQSQQLSPCPPTSASQVSFPVKGVQTARWPSPETDAIFFFFTCLRDGQVQTRGRRIQKLLEWQNVWLHWNTFCSQEEDPSILTHQNSLDLSLSFPHQKLLHVLLPWYRSSPLLGYADRRFLSPQTQSH